MSYSKEISDRIRDSLKNKTVVREQSMFGGRCFMLNGKMLACAGDNEYLFRIGKENFDEFFARPGTRPMVNNGRLMRGFLFVNASVLDDLDVFQDWIDTCLDYNRKIIDQG